MSDNMFLLKSDMAILSKNFISDSDTRVILSIRIIIIKSDIIGHPY